MTSPTAAARGQGSELTAADRFYRAHGLGNDYLVFDRASTEARWRVTPSAVRRVCHRGEGVGSDGLLLLLGREPSDGVFEVRGFNPDGTEFERSGNGLRVLASYLYREGLVRGEPFSVRCGGSLVSMTVHTVDRRGRYDVSAEMGTARLGLESINGDRDALDGEASVVHPTLGRIHFTPVSIGNPHVVIFDSGLPQGALDQVGPFLGRHRAFADGTNVQLAEVLADGRLRIDIWERGVGRTSASGTSSCAAAAAGVATGRLKPGSVAVEMIGGTLSVAVTDALDVTLRGPVQEVCEGRLAAGFSSELAESSRE